MRIDLVETLACALCWTLCPLIALAVLVNAWILAPWLAFFALLLLLDHRQRQRLAVLDGTVVHMDHYRHLKERSHG